MDAALHDSGSRIQRKGPQSLRARELGFRVQGLTGYRSQSFGVRGQQMSPSLAPKQPWIEKYQNHVYTMNQVIRRVESLI